MEGADSLAANLTAGECELFGGILQMPQGDIIKGKCHWGSGHTNAILQYQVV